MPDTLEPEDDNQGQSEKSSRPKWLALLNACIKSQAQ